MKGPDRQRVGVDTTFLLAHSVEGHPEHSAAVAWLGHLLGRENTLLVCPVVFDEFVHVVTDARRFERPATVVEALALVETWVHSKEVECVFPDEAACRLQRDWMREHRLGRKRIHDTAIAATYSLHEARWLLSTNQRDFTIFGCFDVINIQKDIFGKS